MGTEASAPQTEQREPQIFVLLGLAAVIGLAAGLAVLLFLGAEHHVRGFLWDTIPDRFGWAEPPSWWVFTVLLLGAVGVWAALKLPGRGGHRPLDGLGFDIGPQQIASVVAAAIISLSVGAVIGPEAPLMACGSAIAASIAVRTSPQVRQVLMLAGATSAITLILGNPLVAGILVLEVLVLRGSPGGKQMMTTILPVILAMGTGYLLQVGAGSWGGVGESKLAVQGLPAYNEVMGIDVLVLIPVSVVTALIGVAVVEGGTVIQRIAQTRPLPVILAAAGVVATAAVLVRAGTGESVDFVLFSGQESIGAVLTLTSVGTLAAIMVAKSVAYAVSVGSGFRGGLIFPAMYLGVVHATVGAQLVDSASVSALAAAGIAAGVAALLRLPFTSVVLAVLLCSGAGLAVTTPAILGGVIGVLVRVAAEARLDLRRSATAEAN